MKKLLLILSILLGINSLGFSQSVFTSLVRAGGETGGYATLGYTGAKKWGVYLGLPFSEVKQSNVNGQIAVPGINTQNGTLSSKAKVGVLRELIDGKVFVGAGIQPSIVGNKPNLFLAYNPLKASSPVNIYFMGDLVGADFRGGLGLSIKVGR